MRIRLAAFADDDLGWLVLIAHGSTVAAHCIGMSVSASDRGPYFWLGHGGCSNGQRSLPSGVDRIAEKFGLIGVARPGGIVMTRADSADRSNLPDSVRY